MQPFSTRLFEISVVAPDRFSEKFLHEVDLGQGHVDEECLSEQQHLEVVVPALLDAVLLSHDLKMEAQNREQWLSGKRLERENKRNQKILGSLLQTATF
jgi:hypothetical protein